MSDSIYPIIDYAVNFSAEDIPQDVMCYTRDLFQDTIACILSGSRGRA